MLSDHSVCHFPVCTITTMANNQTNHSIKSSEILKYLASASPPLFFDAGWPELYIGATVCALGLLMDVIAACAVIKTM